MENGLAATVVSGSKPSMMYGDGKQNTVVHKYAGTINKNKKGK